MMGKTGPGGSGPGRPVSMFQGMSTLRAEERKKEAAQPKANSAMQDYLKKYTESGGGVSGPSSEYLEPKKKKKKKAAKSDPAGAAVRIIDNDVSGFAAPGKRSFDDEEEEEEDDFRPVIANEEEAKALIKLDKKSRTFESDSNWATVQQEEEEERGRGPGPGSRRAHHDSPDASPPRRTARHDSPDASPPRRPAGAAAAAAGGGRARHDSPDASPPRRSAGGAAGRARHDSPDASPPRRPAAAAAGGGPRGRHDSPDASPPRRGAAAAAAGAGRARHDSPDASPPRRGGRHASPDVSPPRRPAAAAAAAVAAGGARGRHEPPDPSPPRRAAGAAGGRARHDSPDASPPRQRPRGQQQEVGGTKRQRHDSPDASPPRRGGAAPPGDKRARMADGTVAGLVRAEELRGEAAAMRAENERRRLTAEGRGAETVYRVDGGVVSKDEFIASRKDKRVKEKEEKEADQYLEWRQGLAQKREAEERRARMKEEAEAPFARYDVERSHDETLKSRARFGDPFAHLARGREAAAAAAGPSSLTERYNAAALEKSGFKIPQEVPPHSWLKRGVAAPTNRYDIRPGRHWDGVDRGNGTEKQYFAILARRAAEEAEGRAIAQSDM